MIVSSVSATGFEPVTVPIKIGMLYPPDPLINSIILTLLFQDLMTSSLL